MSKNYIIYNGKHSYEDFGLLIDHIILPSINEVIEEIEIEGRNGTLTERKGYYNDRNITIQCSLKRKILEDFEQFSLRLEEVMNWLRVFNKDLILYLNPNRTYKVKNISLGEIETDNAIFYNFEAIFTCEPFSYILNEEIVKITTNNFNYYYKGTVPGEIKFKIYGTGNIQLTINDEVVQINNVTDNITLDSKLLLCLNSDGTNKSKDMIGNFPLFEYDLNTISWTGNVTKIELTPRTAFI